MEVNTASFPVLGIVQGICCEERHPLFQDAVEHGTAHGPGTYLSGEINLICGTRYKLSLRENRDEGSFDFEHAGNGSKNCLEYSCFISFSTDLAAKAEEK